MVYQDALPAQLEYVQGLVLTEWKRARKGQIENAFAEARRQAELYVPGPFSGNELLNYRYAVVVSDEPGAVAQDEQAEGIVYRHILLPVNPSVPSKLARQKRRGSWLPRPRESQIFCGWGEPPPHWCVFGLQDGLDPSPPIPSRSVPSRAPAKLRRGSPLLRSCATLCRCPAHGPQRWVELSL